MYTKERQKQGGTDEGQQERDGILGQAGGDSQERTYRDIQKINPDLKHNTETDLEREEETGCWWIWSKKCCI